MKSTALWLRILAISLGLTGPCAADDELDTLHEDVYKGIQETNKYQQEE